ncbi:hypothetical protein AB0D14_02015 [Streptomyces sp. NPDC048484]|uniref:hypothetical protein n=1 Tax=Streptomyces sp. NPDC048484 TaxID=3155146 RepID=UPI00342D4870
MAAEETPGQWVEDGTLWFRMLPDESVEAFVKRCAAGRGPLTDTEKVQLRDIFAPVLDQPADAA